MIPTLETERLRLRPYVPGDFDGYAQMWGEAYADPPIVVLARA
jgi:hypothetical protein